MWTVRAPPGNAKGGQVPQPYWRFIDGFIDYELFKKVPPGEKTPAKQAAHDVVDRAEEICRRRAWERLHVRAGDAAFFRSSVIGGDQDPRAIHASCNGGEKWVLAKFVRQKPITAEEWTRL